MTISENQHGRAKCRRWYCKNTPLVTTIQSTDGYCARCAKAKENLGWFFNFQPAIRILSWPFLLIGGIGLGGQILPAIRRGNMAGHFGRWLLMVVLASAIFCFGLVLRWVATIASFAKMSTDMSAELKGLSGIFKWSGRKHPLEGSQCPPLCFYDNTGNSITLGDFKNKIVVVKMWAGTSADTIDRKIWKDFDDPRIVFLYVYTGQDIKRFQDEPVPMWQRAKSYLLHDCYREIERKLGSIRGPNCLIIDHKGIIRRVPKYSSTYCNEYYDTPVVKKILRKMQFEVKTPDAGSQA